jgi:hypothetical protein
VTFHGEMEAQVPSSVLLLFFFLFFLFQQNSSPKSQKQQPSNTTLTGNMSLASYSIPDPATLPTGLRGQGVLAT